MRENFLFCITGNFYVVTEEGKVECHDVVAGISLEQEVVITQGIYPVEKVVTDDQLFNFKEIRDAK